MKLMKVSLVVVCGFALMTSAAQAATTKKAAATAKPDPMVNLPRTLAPAFDWKPLAKAYAAQDHKAYRNLAATGPVQFSADYLELKADFVEVEKLAQAGRVIANGKVDQKRDFVYQAAVLLGDKLTSWDRSLASQRSPKGLPLSADTKFALAHMLPMIEMKSLVPRLVGIVKDSRIVRQSVVEQIQEAYSDMKLYFPNSGWEAGFAYVTEPMPGMKDEFTSESDFQAFTVDVIEPRLQKAVELLESISISPQQPLGWDNHLVYGMNAFNHTADDGFYLLREPERYAAIARIYRQRYEIQLGSIYNNNCSVELSKQMGALYGIEIAKSLFANAKALAQTVKGSENLKGLFQTIRDADPRILAPTRRDHVEIVKGVADEKKRCFLLNPKSGMSESNAVEYLKASVGNGFQAWRILQDAGDPKDGSYNSPVFDPVIFKGRHQETIVYFGNLFRMLGMATDMIDGYEKATDAHLSLITGEAVNVTYSDFIHNLPPDSRSLLPEDNGFASDTAYFDRSINGKTVPVRNWGRSRPISWRTDVYRNLFPGLSAGTQVPARMRAWTESRGGASISEFVQNFVR